MYWCTRILVMMDMASRTEGERTRRSEGCPVGPFQHAFPPCLDIHLLSFCNFQPMTIPLPTMSVPSTAEPPVMRHDNALERVMECCVLHFLVCTLETCHFTSVHHCCFLYRPDTAVVFDPTVVVRVIVRPQICLALADI